jgi:hypothetical protein
VTIRKAWSVSIFPRRVPPLPEIYLPISGNLRVAYADEIEQSIVSKPRIWNRGAKVILFKARSAFHISSTYAMWKT